MLAAQLDGASLADPPDTTEVLPAHPFTDRLADRPGLIALARTHVNTYRKVRTIEPDVRVPSWLSAFADTSWANDSLAEGKLLTLAQQNGRRLTSSLRWHAIVSIGFDVPLDPWTHALHVALTGHAPSPMPEGAEGVRARRVPDPVAEARAVVARIQDPEDTLVLVQHDATAARVHRALLRNGLPSAWRGAVRLERHSLASVIRRCVPWFAGAADPSIRASDLLEVLRHPLLAQRLPPAAETWLTRTLEELGETEATTRLTPRELTRAIKRARHLDAPLSRWKAETLALIARTDEPGTAPRAARLHARLLVLEATLTAVPFDTLFETGVEEAEEDWGDFDALVASLIGDDDPLTETELPAPGTLGALRRFLLACRVRTKDDPAALRILGALREGAHRPATRVDALQCLVGSVERAECRTGVEIVTYEDYDGRPSGTLVLCDVHDQGIAARPRPDPLLDDASLASLGLLDARARVRFRLDQLALAVSRSRSPTALVCHHDTMGRVVVPPVQLSLTFEDHPSSPYGLQGDLPELQSTRCLQVVSPTPERRRPVPLQRYADQATAEWFRAGRGPVGKPPHPSRIPGRPTLAHQLAQMPSPPDAIAPLLGRADAVPEAALGPGERSVSRFFRPLSHCLYQAFVRNVLGIGEPETLSEELDAREIGNAVHAALEHAAGAGGWSHDGEQAAVQERFHDALLAENRNAFDAARESFGALSPSRALATRGLEARWATHWRAYAASRSQPAYRGRDAEPRKLLLENHVNLHRAQRMVEAEADRRNLPPVGFYTLRAWLLRIVAEDLDAPLSTEALLGFGRDALPTAWEPAARDFLQHPALRRLQHTSRRTLYLENALTQPLLGVASELAFGSDAGAGVVHGPDGAQPASIGPLTLRLGDEEVDTRGFIDRVDLVGVPREPLLRITDYKSGANAPNTWNGFTQLMELKEPQLVVYALALREAVRQQRLPEVFAPASVATVGWDHLRATRLVKEQLVLKEPSNRFLLDDTTLDLLARALGSLVTRARTGDWPLSPRPDTCPASTSWGHDHCPYVGACRFQQLPDPEAQ